MEAKGGKGKANPQWKWIVVIIKYENVNTIKKFKKKKTEMVTQSNNDFRL